MYGKLKIKKEERKVNREKLEARKIRNKKEEIKVNREKLEARKIRNKKFKFKIKNKLVISLFFDYLNLAFE